MDLETTKQRIRERLTATGLSANDASRRAKLGLSYVNDLLSGKSKNPVPHRIAQLAEVLQCDPAYLMGELPASRPAPEPETSGMSLFTVGLPDAEGFFTLDDNARRSISLASPYATADAYAIVVPDDANAPRYFAGEIVIASPSRPVSRGGFAVIRMTDGRATIRRVDMIASSAVRVSNVDGGSIVDIPKDQIGAVHKIVGSGEHYA